MNGSSREPPGDPALTDLESLQRLATVVKDSNDAIILIDLFGHIMAWNRGAEIIYGYSDAEALGMDIMSLVPDSERERNEAMMKKLRGGEQITSFETKRITKARKEVDIQLTITSLKDRRGKPYAIATTERDVSEIKHNAENLRQTVERLQRRTEELETAREELEVSNEEIRSMNDELDQALKHIQGLDKEIIEYSNIILKYLQNPLREMNVAIGTLLNTQVSEMCPPH
ncbi:MAG TPA: PAS domain S-box protein [Methanocella sp.]|nr:PAS domain S-box protein [Methanocella sp.]